jgi:hypothetical protein
MSNDHLTAPLLSAAMDEIITLRNRIEALEEENAQLRRDLSHARAMIAIWRQY